MPDKGLFDIHCHIVPSVDDGASSAEEAYKMLQMEYRQGVRNIIATPHYRLQMFETPIKTVEHQFLVLKQLHITIGLLIIKMQIFAYVIILKH